MEPATSNKRHQKGDSSVPRICPLNTLAQSPVCQEELDVWLKKYPQADIAQQISDGFRFGFKVGYTGTIEHRIAENHGSARAQPSLVTEKLMKEVELGRVAGPFKELPMPDLIVSPLGLVKKSTPGKFRLIFDLSYPQYQSVNDGIPIETSSVTYTPFDAVIAMVQRLGQGAQLIKIDIESAFRLLPLHPDDYKLMGMRHEGEYFVDKALPFGCSSSCALFEQFSTFLEWCARTAANTDNLIHYLDDFCGGESSSHKAKEFLETVLQLFSQLGVPVAKEKIEGPSTCLKFLGLIVDTQKMEIRIPLEKIKELSTIITNLLEVRKKTTLRELQVLLGKLNFACRAVIPGRPFCRRLLNAICGITKPHHKIRVTQSMKKDLKVWQSFLTDYNGRSIILDEQWCDSDSMELFTDAAGSIGFGAYFQGQWTWGRWPAHWDNDTPDITFKELFPIVLALHLWSGRLKNKKIRIHCDNQAVVNIINKQTTRSAPSMELVRILVLSCLNSNIVFTAQHIPGKHNRMADLLSRGQLGKFRRIAPTAAAHPTPIPDHLLALFKLK